MNTTRLITITTIAAIAAVSVAYTLAPSAPTMSPVERGRYLVATSGCHDCHTPWHMTAQGPAPDMTRMLSGHPQTMPVASAPPPSAEWPLHASPTNTAWAGPWGVSFTANLTSDRDTGLGAWTADEFVAAIRTGRHQGKGREILPPMPWPMYRQMTDDDLRAMFVYLQTVPPITNKVPEPLPPAQAK